MVQIPDRKDTFRSFVAVVFMALLISCDGTGSLEQTQTEAATSEPAQRLATPGQAGASLRFIPTPTPDTTWDKVKADVEAANLNIQGVWSADDDSIYALIAKCGGAIPIRDSLIKAVLPKSRLAQVSEMDGTTSWSLTGEDGNLRELQRSVIATLTQTRNHAIRWSVTVESPYRMGRRVAEGNIEDDCDVTTEFVESA